MQPRKILFFRLPKIYGYRPVVEQQTRAANLGAITLNAILLRQFEIKSIY
jgi:hypothetical protein